jgi:hypothetical protein
MVKAAPATSGVLQRQCACGQHTSGAECGECRKKIGEVSALRTLQRAAAHDDTVKEVPPIVYDVLRSSGQPLDPVTHAFFAARFGYDFSHVRVHVGAPAAQSARAVNAEAYTVGEDVVFGAGRYAPRTSGGQRLLAHELTHVVQQSYSTSASRPINMGGVADPAEREAEAASHYATRGLASPAVVAGRNELCLQRQQATPPELPAVDVAVADKAMSMCPNLEDLLLPWYTNFYLDRINEEYSSALTDDLPSMGRLKLWKWLSRHGEVDLDVYFTPPGRGEQHVKLIVRLESSGGNMIAHARLYDWLGPEWVVIGRADKMIVSTDGRCKLEELPPPPQPQREQPAPIYDEGEGVPV